MTCATCQNCHEEGINHCAPVVVKAAEMRKKLQNIKDFACVIGSTTSLNLPKTVSKFGFMVWNLLRDIEKEVSSTQTRVYSVCKATECLNNRVTALQNEIQRALNASALGNVRFSATGQGTSSGGSSTRVSFLADGTFLIGWDMIDAYGKVGEGVMNGIIRHKYSVNENTGAIRADIDSVEFGRVEYKAYRAGNSIARFRIDMADGRNVMDMQYNPYKSWVHTLAVSHGFRVGADIAPGGNWKQAVVKTTDTWQANPTYSTIYANYHNGNESPINFNKIAPCDIDCDTCVEV